MPRYLFLSGSKHGITGTEDTPHLIISQSKSSINYDKQEMPLNFLSRIL
jgi:hypothetical protein